MALLLGKTAPDFTSTAVKGNELIENFRLSDYREKYVVLFFYPLDFTFVCPTELHAFNERIERFRERATEVIAVSVDSHYSHFAWLHTPRIKGGIEGVRFPIVSDITKEISRAYDVLVPDKGIAYRALFLLDKNQIVRHALVNDLFLGRNVDEVLRLVDALQFHEAHGEVCPAGWQKGAAAMVPTQKGLEEYFSNK